MKNLFLTWIIALVITTGFSQQPPIETKTNRYSVGAQYNHEFVLGGYVQVREWDLQGDKMKLKDLGMKSYPAAQFHVARHVRNNGTIAIAYDHYFMSGSSTFGRDITYNGTIINGRKGIDVSPTRYFRLSVFYTGILLNKRRIELGYKVGLVLDHITFYLDGEVTASSPKDEVLEGFGRQAFPYPVLGFQGEIELDHGRYFNLDVSGTYVPKFESFYTEGGNVHLQYSNFESGLNYSRTIADFELAVGARFRYMHLFQESNEDTNVITTITLGPTLKIAYSF